MRVGIIQPPYPTAATGAADTLQYFLKTLETVQSPHDLIVLPEYANAAGISSRDELIAFTDMHTQPFLAALSGFARSKRAAICVNALLRDGGRIYNTTAFIDRDGSEIFRYAKTHLTETESSGWQVTPGDAAQVFEWEGMRVGFLTCFDIYFPEFVETLAALCPDLVIFPTYQRSEDSDVIVRQTTGRALDLEACVVRASYAMGPASRTGGQSLITNARGDVLLNAEQRTGFFAFEFDPHQKRTRPIAHGLPPANSRQIVDKFRRPGLYRAAERGNSSRKSYPRVCAHRGLSGLCPENTLPAFGAAVALGADEIELDVWASRDGELVVCHDDDVARTSNGAGKIHALSWEEIRAFDAGSRFQASGFGGNTEPYMRSIGELAMPTDWSGTRICRLEEVFEQFGGKVVMNLHLKEAGKDGFVVRKTAELARSFGIAHQVYLAGWNDVLTAAIQYAPDLERCCLDGQTEGTLVDNAIASQCQRLQFWNPHFTDADIARAKAHGMTCNLFHADDPAEARALLDRGIDVILTNFTNRILPVIQARREMTLARGSKQE